MSLASLVAIMAAMNGNPAAADGLAPAARRALAAFVAHLRDERGLSPHTVAAYQRDAAQFLGFAARAGVTDPAAVEPLLLRRFLALQRTRGLAASSIARKAPCCAPCSASSRAVGWWPRTRRPGSAFPGDRGGCRWC